MLGSKIVREFARFSVMRFLFARKPGVFVPRNMSARKATSHSYRIRKGLRPEILFIIDRKRCVYRGSICGVSMQV
jgi:hypothetical protein